MTDKKLVYVLFETDLHMSRSSRIFLGVFETREKAEDAASIGDCYKEDTSVQIIETELNNFEEQ